MEKTYVMLKPDAVKRKLAGEIISKIEKKNFQITNMKMFSLTEEKVREHYSHLVDRVFFGEILEFMTSGPVIGMVVEGDGVIDGVRRLIGPTKWEEALPGTIRGDYANTTNENLIHGSDSKETAEKEIKRFMV